MRDPPRSPRTAVKEKQMGRPINKRYIGDYSQSGQQIQMTAYIPGDSGYNWAYINAQKGTNTYKATRYDGSYTGLVQLVDGPEGSIDIGQAHIHVLPYEGGTKFAKHICNRTVTCWDGSTYEWVDSATTPQAGQAQLQTA
jgi:hypothetical protein